MQAPEPARPEIKAMAQPPRALPQLSAIKRIWRKPALPGSKSAPKPVPRTSLPMLLRTWHKRLGIFAFVFMGWLGLSGILINQSPSWGYDTQKLYWPWVMALYSLHPEPPTQGFSSKGHWLTEAMDATLLDGKPLPLRISQQLGMAVGGTQEQPLLFIADPKRVIVLDRDHQLVDQMSGYTLPVADVRRIGMIAGTPAQVVIQDLDAYATTDGLEWKKLPVNAEVQWSQPQPLPEAERNKALPYSRPSVTIEHVLVDAHSGHLFGSWGAWVINFVGIAAIGLSITGIWMTWRMSRQRRQASR